MMHRQIFEEVNPTDGAELPLGFEPYQTLTFCSNALVNVPIPIRRDGGPPPILVGKGPASPRVWMTAGGLLNGKPTFFLIVKDNVSQSPQVQVADGNGETKITAHGVAICVVRAVSEAEGTVTKLDLRPTGLNVHGDSEGLWVGGSRFTRNGMQGGQAFISIG